MPIFDTVLNGTSVIGSIVGTRQDLDEVFQLHDVRWCAPPHRLETGETETVMAASAEGACAPVLSLPARLLPGFTAAAGWHACTPRASRL
ncbi:hypothetical protein [Streptomyces sp. NBC_00878]|uniref:hypothetical protein n=1 Tax=Streptomyces sp. NBC_00878 TaxID=2975854 RepID=UPI002254CFB1|nr:hypothetical protein [Streptomyces sp. NBC_00878]MCX4904012.1 hypothetical protein [Streptomyces sp. NBC_00878]